MNILKAFIAVMLTATANAADRDHVIAEFLKAFKSGDAQAMSKSFSDKVEYIGDHRFLGLEKQMQKPEMFDSAVIAKAYADLFERRAKEGLMEEIAKTKPTTVVSENGGELLGFVKKGDIICDIHMREARKGERNGFDEAVIFVFRKVGDDYKMVFHLADW